MFEEPKVGDVPARQSAAVVDSARVRALVGARYVVQAYAGAGTLGSTWNATDVTSKADIALRVIEAPAGDVRTVLTACRRLQTAAVSADHPGIVAPCAVEPGSDGAVLVATPYLDGGSLSDMLGGPEPLPFDAAITVLRDVAAVLAHAHARGLVHGGLAPSNVFADADGRARLTDFGLSDVARVLPPASDGRSRALNPYSAPEQWRGEYAEPRTDQYALAVIAYELLSGERRHAPSVEGIETIEPLDVSAFAPLRPGLGLHVNDALRTALSASPANRFQTVAHFADALAGRAPGHASRHATPFAGTRPLVTGVVVASVAITIAAAAFAFSPRFERSVASRWRSLSRAADVAAVGAITGGTAVRLRGSSAARPTAPAATGAPGKPEAYSDRYYSGAATLSPNSGVHKGHAALPAASPDAAPSSDVESAAELRGAASPIVHRAVTSGTRPPGSFGYVSVSASAGAPVAVVDGRRWGVAPTVIAVSTGMHEVEVRGPGMHYRPSRITLRVTSGDTTVVAFWREPR